MAADAVQKVTQDSLRRATEDLDLFVCMGINPGDQNDISAHSTNMSTLAVAVGAMIQTPFRNGQRLGVLPREVTPEP